MEAAHCMPNPWVSLRRDQLILVNKVVNKKEKLEKGLEEEAHSDCSGSALFSSGFSLIHIYPCTMS
jgi:hypothetical protein